MLDATASPASAARKKLNKLRFAHQVKLAEFLRAEYAKSGLSDKMFSQKASVALGFMITEGNVHGMRTELEIPSNQEKRREERSRTILARIEDLETTVANLMEIVTARKGQ